MSARVKLNRVTLKDVLRLKLVPSQRRPPTTQTVVTAQDTASGPKIIVLTGAKKRNNKAHSIPEGQPEKSCKGMQKAKRSKNIKSCKGNIKEFKHEGPLTRGRYQQGRPNTRSKCRLDHLRKQSVRFPCCFCPASNSVHTLSGQTDVHGQVKTTCQFSSQPLTSAETPKSRTVSHLKHGVSKSRSRRGGVKGKTGVNRDGDRGRRGQGQLKARSSDLQSAAAANARQAAKGARSRPTNVERNTHPSPVGLAQESRRRAARADGCGLGCDYKYVPHRRKPLGKKGLKSSSSGPEGPAFEVKEVSKIKEENRAPEASQKIIIWTDQRHCEALCDISQSCDAFCPDHSSILPDVLKTKAVRCFKREMRAGFRFEPSCFGHNKNKSENGTVAKNRQTCATVQSEGRLLQSQSLTPEHQTCPKAHTQTVSSHITQPFPTSCTSESSATCSASFFQGKRAGRGEFRADMSDRDAGEDPGARIHLPAGAGNLTSKKTKLRVCLKDEVLQSTSNSKCLACKSPAKIDTGENEKTCVCISDDSQSCAEQEAGCSRTLGSAVREKGVHKKSLGDMHIPTITDAAQMSAELFCQKNEMDTDELGFTCQRVRVYFRENSFSCARTFMPWPFSNRGCARTAHALTPICPGGPVNPSKNSDSSVNQNKPDRLNNCTDVKLTNSSKGPFSVAAQQFSHQNDGQQHESGEGFLIGWNGKRLGNTSSSSPDSTNKDFAPDSVEAEESLPSPPSDRREPSADAASSLSFIRLQSDHSMSTPSPSVAGLSDMETATSLSSSPSLLLPKTVRNVDLASASSPNCVSQSLDKPSYYCAETRMSSCSSSVAPPHSPDSVLSCESFILLPQEKKDSDEELIDPPKQDLCYNTNPIKYGKETLLSSVLSGNYIETERALPPVLSPVTSPHGRSKTSLLPQSSIYCHDNEHEREIRKNTYKHSPECHLQIINSNHRNSQGVEQGIEGSEGPWRELQSSSSNEDLNESQDETDCEDDAELGNITEPQMKMTLATDVLTEPHSSVDEECNVAERLNPSKSNERDQTDTVVSDDTVQGILDEFTAYEQDILLVDITQDDPELFENLPQESLLKLGPVRVSEDSKIRPIGGLLSRSDGPFPKVEQRLNPVIIDYNCDSTDDTEESDKRPWRPKCSSIYPKSQSSTWLAPKNQMENMGRADVNNNHENRGFERIHPIKTTSSLHNHVPALRITDNGISHPENVSEFRRHKSNAYCRQYFSESLSCGFKMCRFQHVPVDGDEKFCIETVKRFTKNPMCLQKAGAVFTGYYSNNPPGVYFSMAMLLPLLWALLKAGMVSDVFSVLGASVAHKIVPGHEFVLALFNFVREKHLVGLVPQLMQLTFKMVGAGLGLSLDCLDCVKNTSEVQQMVCPNSVSGKGPPNVPFPEYLNLAHAVVEIELCTVQEDWKRMGEVFRSLCQYSQRPNQLERISGRVAIALLSESKDKQSLPFADFAERVCQKELEDELVKSSFGRIGVSLMLRYHKTHQWAKGRKVVEVLSNSKIKYSILKGLFGNEDRASRCFLVTVATELFLLSGSIAGALNTLRENNWFLSSKSWPCDSADLESRTRVLLRLAEKTSHRGTLEILCNLPGLKEQNALVNISSYCSVFNIHVQVCVDRQTLTVASDTVDFMLSKNLAVEPALLQILLQKLGKQNLWLRAREVFRHSLSVGYYPGVSAPPGFMTLIVPCQLGEVELALTLEMFITVNASVILHLTDTATCSLSITLKRTQSGESEYISAGSRVLSAACIPQPNLTIQYTAVNSSQEQVFTLDISSARSWLRHNHLWANEVWAH